ncbi:MAG: tetratricopeptide repeat protein [Candidatus Thorarchaeota archaeon]|nr:tetratricopeptide repeat protein [Candidatus Thorarchaeota archaeon]
MGRFIRGITKATGLHLCLFLAIVPCVLLAQTEVSLEDEISNVLIPPHQYRLDIQISNSDYSWANSMANSLRAESGEVRLQENGESISLIVDGIIYEADALLLLEDILHAESGSIDHYSMQRNGEEIAVDGDILNLEERSFSGSMFDSPYSRLDALPVLEEGANPVFDALESMRRSSSAVEFREALVSAYTESAPNDILRGYAMNRLGILYLTEGDYDRALRNFNAVAEGALPADQISVAKSMRRVGWILHQRGDRLSAYRAYGEFLAFADVSNALAGVESGNSTDLEWEMGHAVVERVGLIYELLVHHRVGSFAEVRLAIRDSLEALPGIPEFTQRRATLELMFLETFHHEGYYEHSNELANDFIHRYMQFNDHELWREIGQAMFLRGHNEFLLGNYEQAMEYYDMTIQQCPADVEYFAHENPAAKSFHGIGTILFLQGDSVGTIDMYRHVVQNYPDSGVAQTIAEHYPTLVRR